MSEVRYWLVMVGLWVGGLIAAAVAVIALMWVVYEATPDVDVNTPGGGSHGDYPEPADVEPADPGW